MKLSEATALYRLEIRAVVLAHHANNPRVFGSVLRGEDHEGSDLDLLADLTPETTLVDIGAMRRKLDKLLGVLVDVLTPKSSHISFRYKVVSEAVPVRAERKEIE